MNKAEFIEAMAAKAKVPASQAGSVLNALISTVETQLKKNNEIKVTGFGTWKSRKRKAHMGRNPKTGESVKISARKVPVFTAGATLKAAIS